MKASNALRMCTTALCIPVLIPLAAHGVDPSRRISQYSHVAWRLQDGFFTGSPSVVTQTFDGYLWVGTANGLFRFDGAQFKPATTVEGKPIISSITALLAAKDGSIWFTSGSLLQHLTNGHLTQYKRDGPTRHANTIVQSKDGNIWVVYTRKPLGPPLCRVDGTRLRCYGASEGVFLSFADSLAEDADGNLWLSNSSKVEAWKPGGSGTVYSPPELEAVRGISGFSVLSATPDGSMWAGVNQKGHGLGLQHVVRGHWSAITLPGFDSSQLSANEVKQDREGSLWIGTEGDGLYRIHGDRVDHYRAADGLTSDSVSSIFEDHEGDIWVTTSKGLDKFRDLSVATYSTTEGLKSDKVTSVAAATDGSVWIGNRTYLQHLHNGNLSSIDHEQGLPGALVTSLLPDHLNRLWIGIDHTLFMFSSGKYTAFTKRGGTPIGMIYDLAEDTAGTIWATTPSDAAIFRVLPDHTVDTVATPGARVPIALKADSHGGLWVSFEDGNLAYLKDGHWALATPGGEGPRGAAQQMALTNDDAVFGSTPVGIIAWRNGRPRKLGLANGLPCDKTYAVIFDRTGTLWAYAECGLLSIGESEVQRWWRNPDAKLQVRVFDILDGAQPMRATFQPRAALASDGSIWFANDTVSQQVNPLALYTNQIRPPVFVESITADRKQYPLQNNLKLPALSRDIEIDYSALSFRIPERVRFRYRLDGWDKDWQDVSTRRQAFYTNLRPGPYRFHVIACNSDGLWNEVGATLDFSIAPRYYQTSWFMLLSGLALILVAWSLYLVRLRQATARIQERLGARLEERERIARELHDTLLQGVHGLMLRFQGITKTLPAVHPCHKMMSEALDRADELLLQARQEVKDIRADGISERDLPDMLRACAEELQVNNSAALKVTCGGTPRLLDVTVCTEVYRIAREAMFNSCQHSGAANIEIETTYDPDHLRVSVRDDGRGIEPQLLNNGKAGHWGLSGMRERAEKIGARFRIWSKEGAGMEVELTIPGKVAYSKPGKPSVLNKTRARKHP